MSVTLTLNSNIHGEIKRFLDSFYEKDTNIEEDVCKWIYVYKKPLEAVDIISAVLDNKDAYSIEVSILMPDGNSYDITEQNMEDVIKGFYCLFYSFTS